MAKILLVEDNEMNRDMLSRRLERQGYEVIIAVDGGEGVARAESCAPDLILMDMSLPVVDGWETTRRIKAAPATRHVPVIALTAHATAEDRDKAARRRLRRLRHQTDRVTPLAGEDQRSARAGGIAVSNERVPSDAIRHLRHELRTPINHVLGFGDLLRDVAADAGHDDVVTELTRIHTAGEEALAIIGDFLSGDTLSADDLRSTVLHDRLHGPVDQITAACAAVRQAAARLDLPDMIPDLDVIDEAACRLLTLAADLPALIGHGHDENGHPIDGHAGHHAEHYDAEVAVATPASAHAGGAEDRTYRLLVVDDNAANREVLTRSLERLGYAVSQAVNGRQALEMAATARFDLMLLDIMMPDVDGYQVLGQLRTDETLRDIPVIVISALHEMSSVIRCIAMGAEDYLPKPFDAVLLRARIGACLEKKRLRDHEVEYLRQVAHVTTAAAVVEVGAFDPASLAAVAERADGVGQLARVFQRMAREVDARERRLKDQVHELQIAIDRTREARQVAEITDTDYFRDLQAKARRLRDRSAPDSPRSSS